MTASGGERPALSQRPAVAGGRTGLAGIVLRTGSMAARAVGWLSDGLDRLTVMLAAALTAAMAVALALQVLFRFVLRTPLSWSEELARYCFVWLSSLGAAGGVRRGLHPGLDLLPARWSGRARRLAASLGAVLSALFLAVLAVYGWRLAAFNMRQHSPAMGLPMGVPYAAIPAGAGVMLVHLLARVAASPSGPGKEGGR
ncbi:MAG: TRAP transporter small permease [Bacillota bacterium]